MSDQTDDASSHQVKMRKTSPESNHAPMTDGCDYPLKWSSHLTGVARDESKALRPDQRVNYDMLQRDMRRIFESATKQ
jgi:hypothetical protein